MKTTHTITSIANALSSKENHIQSLERELKELETITMISLRIRGKKPTSWFHYGKKIRNDDEYWERGYISNKTLLDAVKTHLIQSSKTTIIEYKAGLEELKQVAKQLICNK